MPRSDFVLAGRPVVLRGLAAQWLPREFADWQSKADFVQSVGGVLAERSAIPYADAYGVDGGATGPIVEFVQRYMGAAWRGGGGSTPLAERPYIFDARATHPITVGMPPPPLVPPHYGAPAMRQFSLGGHGTGAPPHFHGEAFNGLLFGRKRWLFFRPRDAFFSRRPARAWWLQWTANDSNAVEGLSRRAQQAIQDSGDVIYVPKYWGHAVVNLGDCGAVAFEYL